MRFTRRVEVEKLLECRIHAVKIHAVAVGAEVQTPLFLRCCAIRKNAAISHDKTHKALTSCLDRVILRLPIFFYNVTGIDFHSVNRGAYDQENNHYLRGNGLGADTREKSRRAGNARTDRQFLD